MSAENNLPPSSSENPPPAYTPGTPSAPPSPPTPDPLPGPVPFNGGFGRFTTYIAIGAVAGGVSSAIPILGCLNLFCCLLNIAGVALALHLYLKKAPQDTISNGEAAGFGALSGAGAGIIYGLLNLVIGAASMRAMMAFLERVNPEAAQQFAPMMVQSGVQQIIGIVFNFGVFTAFGALGGVLAMQLFFKARLRK